MRQIPDLPEGDGLMRRERLNLGSGMSIETSTDQNGRFYIACRRGCAMFFRQAKPLRKFLGLPLKTPSREAFDSWIASLEAADAKRKGAEPLTSEEPVQQTSPSLSQELLETGFGPEVFSGELDESDPNHSTRVVI